MRAFWLTLNGTLALLGLLWGEHLVALLNALAFGLWWGIEE